MLNADKHRQTLRFVALSWCALNIPPVVVVAALMVLFKHAVGDVSVVKLGGCLLSCPDSFVDVDDLMTVLA